MTVPAPAAAGRRPRRLALTAVSESADWLAGQQRPALAGAGRRFAQPAASSMRPVLKAQLLMATSGLLASFVSLDANYLTHAHDYYHWTQVLFVNGVTGTVSCCLCYLATRRCGCRKPSK